MIYSNSRSHTHNIWNNDIWTWRDRILLCAGSQVTYYSHPTFAPTIVKKRHTQRTAWLPSRNIILYIHYTYIVVFSPCHVLSAHECASGKTTQFICSIASSTFSFVVYSVVRTSQFAGSRISCLSMLFEYFIFLVYILAFSISMEWCLPFMGAETNEHICWMGILLAWIDKLYAPEYHEWFSTFLSTEQWLDIIIHFH